MGPLNNRMPRWCQFKWGEMHGAFERKRSEKKASMSDKERKKAEHKNEKMLKKFSLKDQG